MKRRSKNSQEEHYVDRPGNGREMSNCTGPSHENGLTSHLYFSPGSLIHIRKSNHGAEARAVRADGSYVSEGLV
jgi:hypothetical protein